MSSFNLSGINLSGMLYIDSQQIPSLQINEMSQSEEEQIAQAENLWNGRAEHLPLNRQLQFKGEIRRLVGNILAQIDQMKALNCTSLQIRSAVNQSIIDLHTSLEAFHSQNAKYELMKVDVEEGHKALATKIQSASVNFSAFIPKKRESSHSQGFTVPELYPSSKATETTAYDPFKSQALLEIQEYMAGMHVIAGAIHLAGNAVTKAAEVLLCGTSVEGKQNCKSVLNLAERAGKATLEAAGLKEPVKEAIRYLQSFDGSTVAKVLTEYGLPSEQAQEQAKQYVADIGTISLQSLPIGVLGTLAKKGATRLAGRVTTLSTESAASTALSPAITSTTKATIKPYSLTTSVTESKSVESFAQTSIARDAIPVVTDLKPIRSKIINFIKDESGCVKLPRDREFYIKTFLDLGYKIGEGGKGSHLKLSRPNSPMVIIPSNKELANGTAKSLMQIYEKAKSIDNESRIVLVQNTSSKLIKEPFHDKPFPHRIDYSEDYFKGKNEFIMPKEFDGILSRDLLVMQYHSSEPLHEFRTHKWFMPICEGNQHCSIGGIQDAVAKLSAYGEISEVTLARIPAGEPVRFLHGRAKEKIHPVDNEIRPGGGVQYRFFDFDMKWIVKTRKLPF
jgi:predicted RNA binding protein YcfA (HicA-like mRNA interferase family)